METPQLLSWTAMGVWVLRHRHKKGKFNTWKDLMMYTMHAMFWTKSNMWRLIKWIMMLKFLGREEKKFRRWRSDLSPQYHTEFVGGIIISFQYKTLIKLQVKVKQYHFPIWWWCFHNCHLWIRCTRHTFIVEQVIYNTHSKAHLKWCYSRCVPALDITLTQYQNIPIWLTHGLSL